ncbi:MAG: glycoside hydrolase family 31 protein [Anaerolineales bacterium]
MDSTLQGIQHEPYGLEHPYQQAPFERVPHDPQAGEPVSLGVVVRPCGSAQEVWATWRSSENTEQKTGGHWVEDWEEFSSWQVDLPAFSAGERVVYRLYALQSGQQVQTQEFSFQVVEWFPLTRLTSWEKSEKRLTLELVCACPDAQPRLKLSFPSAGRLQLAWNLGHAATTTSDPLKPDIAHIPFEVQESGNHLVVKTEALQVVFTRQPFKMCVKDTQGTILLEECEPAAVLADGSGRLLSFRQRFSSDSEEGFYGFGERFNALNQRGQRLDVRVFEEFARLGLKNYIPIPFFLSARGYGHYIQSHRYVAYDLAANNPAVWSYTAELGQDARLDIHLIAAPEPARIVQAFTDLTGKPELPPAWVFGPWMSGNEWDSQERIVREVELSRQHGIPASVLVIEAWSDETTFYIWNDAQYTPRQGGQPFSYADFTFPSDGRWPDPKGLIDWLHEQGIRVLLWQIPVLKKVDFEHEQHQNDEAFMRGQKYAVLDADEQPYRVRPFWFHDGLLLDFTNPQAVEWWLNQRAYLLDELGIDGFKTDGGEHLWCRGARFANGMQGDEGWNQYANLYVGAYHHFVKQKRNGDAVTFSRAGSTGAQAFPCHWAGDEYSTWEAFRGSVLAGLNAGLSGIPFWGWDLAGFSGEIPDAELYLRSAAMATFCPILQYHMDYNAHRQPSRDRTPWNIAERTATPQVIDIYRKFATLRLSMLDYIEQEAKYCAETGEPLMRALFVDWPYDPNAWQIPYQYSFGRALLVAPVVEPGLNTQDVYLPDGEWVNFWNGERYQGGRWIACPAPLDEIPVFRRLDRPWPGLKD